MSLLCQQVLLLAGDHRWHLTVHQAGVADAQGGNVEVPGEQVSGVLEEDVKEKRMRENDEERLRIKKLYIFTTTSSSNTFVKESFPRSDLSRGAKMNKRTNNHCVNMDFLVD